MVLFDNVVQILGLAQFYVQASVIVDAAYGRRIGPAFVDGDFLGQAVQVNSSLQIGKRPAAAY